MMGPDDLAILIAIAIGFVAFSLYAGLRLVAEAIDTFSARLVSRKINVDIGPLPTIHVQHEEV
jgi:hypothetical protein